MELADRIVVVTGGASGIGKAMAERFHREGAAKVVVADLDEVGAGAVAESVSGWSMGVDVSRETDIVQLIEETEERFGPIDLFCSNAGSASAGASTSRTRSGRRSGKSTPSPTSMRPGT